MKNLIMILYHYLLLIVPLVKLSRCANPTMKPTRLPTMKPTRLPTSRLPSKEPSHLPSQEPSSQQPTRPTELPSIVPSFTNRPTIYNNSVFDTLYYYGIK